VVGPRRRGSRLAVGGKNTQHIAYHLSGELCCVIPATRACVCPTDHLTCEHAGIFVQPASILGNFSMGKYLGMQGNMCRSPKQKQSKIGGYY